MLCKFCKDEGTTPLKAVYRCTFPGCDYLLCSYDSLRHMKTHLEHVIEGGK